MGKDPTRSLALSPKEKAPRCAELDAQGGRENVVELADMTTAKKRKHICQKYQLNE